MPALKQRQVNSNLKWIKRPANISLKYDMHLHFKAILFFNLKVSHKFYYFKWNTVDFMQPWALLLAVEFLPYK